MFYYEEGNLAAYKVPDVFVVKGIAKRKRRIYKLWEEGVAPCVVFEVTSSTTWLEDWGNKRALYEKLEVNEYFLFDPLDEYLSSRLQGFRLVKGYYQPMALSPEGTLHSEELGLRLQPEGTILRLVDPITGNTLPPLDEAVEIAIAEAERAEIEVKRAGTAEAELARLQAELERLRRERGQA